ncbi:uncharacterized protein LOC110860518 [Folsomia candida]|uniref:uncharacterized protein LOC110860518 n=1 Tax=Folsomia candida TaxID=158441 RepID=UPI000B8FE124|nr:uncharacterized protein LOC110860518 [Folsomia candida]
MATVTKSFRWGETSLVDSGDDRSRCSGGASGAVGIHSTSGHLNNMQTMVGLRMILSPGLIRDTGCGPKLFTIIPPSLSTVREFKNHLSTNILKTHIPFYFFNGDYRIPDEEDIRIFSLLSEPCRVVPVPQPKSVLSISGNGSGITTTSTPLPNGLPLPPVHSTEEEDSQGTPPSSKRVKFSDTFSPDGIGLSNGGGGMDKVDLGGGKRKKRQTTNDNDSIVALNGSANPPSMLDSSVEVGAKRRKRHRKHKSKKSKPLPETNDDEEEATNKDCFAESDDRMVLSPEGESTEKSQATTAKINLKGLGPLAPKKSSIILGYDADESEMDLSQKVNSNNKTHSSPSSKGANNNKKTEQQQKFSILISTTTEPICIDDNQAKKKKKSLDIGEFISPNDVVDQKYKRIRDKSSSSSKSKFNSNSIAETPIQNTFGSSGYEDIDSYDSSSGRRKDTPMLPKILKNPSATYELVKKSLSFNQEVGSESESLDEVAVARATDDLEVQDIDIDGESSDSDNEDSTVATAAAASTKSPPNLSIGQVKIGDKISFKMVEMDENYSPGVSDVKVAKIIDKDDTEGVLELQYIGEELAKKKERSGIYEIEDEELESEPLDNPTTVKFTGLLSLSIVKE